MGLSRYRSAAHRSPLWDEGGRERGAVISPWKLSEKRMLTGRRAQ